MAAHLSLSSPAHLRLPQRPLCSLSQRRHQPQPAFLRASSASTSSARPCSLSFSASFLQGLPRIPRPLSGAGRRPDASSSGVGGSGSGRLLVLAMAPKKAPKPKKKMDSAVKRALLGETRRVYNKSRKTEMSTRMKKVFKALEDLRRSGSPNPEDLVPIEKLIGEAYSIIDKSVKVGTIHKNKGANRKSRLARAKRDVSIALGWYSPGSDEAQVAA